LIAVDTSVWIDFFRDAPTPQVARLVAAIEADEVVVLDLVLTEVLQGCDTGRDFSAVLAQFAPYPLLEVVDGHIAVEAARNYRHLRARGVTVRKTIDTLIATRCIVDGLPLLYSDRDFDPFVRHLGLRPAVPA
jgi:predicted nucleic acid-binding protein